MVALLTSDPIYRLPQPAAPGAPFARRPRPRHLHAVPTPGAVAPGADAGISTPTDAEAPALRRSDLMAVAVVVVLALLVVGSFRTVQGPPAEATWSTLTAQQASAPAAVGERVISVQPGDTLWGIAGVVAPHLDRREAVQILADRNGGASIWAGQELVVPAAVFGG